MCGVKLKLIDRKITNELMETLGVIAPVKKMIKVVGSCEIM